MRLRSAVLIYLLVFLNACHEETTANINAQDNHEEIKKPGTALLPNDYTIQGKLEFKEIPSTNSWESYDGLEFFIIDNHGLKFPLMESDTVSREELKNFAGKEIEVEVYPYQPANCPPDSFCGTYPVDRFGNQIRRTIRFKVLKVKKIEGPLDVT